MQVSCIIVMTAITTKPETTFNPFDLDLIDANIPPMGIFKLSIATILMVISGFSEARPISYPGGSTFMARHDARQNSLYYHYSPTYKLSVGLETVNDYTIDETYSLARMTYLLYRKNTAQSQRNLYLAGGVSPRILKTTSTAFMATGSPVDGFQALICVEPHWEKRTLTNNPYNLGWRHILVIMATCTPGSWQK